MSVINPFSKFAKILLWKNLGFDPSWEVIVCASESTTNRLSCFTFDSIKFISIGFSFHVK